jgi:hypothetical protein
MTRFDVHGGVIGTLEQLVKMIRQADDFGGIAFTGQGRLSQRVAAASATASR